MAGMVACIAGSVSAMVLAGSLLQNGSVVAAVVIGVMALSIAFAGGTAVGKDT